MTRTVFDADGASLSLSELALDVGFTCPVVLSDEVWSTCVAWNPSTEACAGQSESGRLCDVLSMGLLAQEHAMSVSRRRMEFDVAVVPSGAEEPVLRRLVWNAVGYGPEQSTVIRTADEFEG
jgi:hypothetical protein